MVQEQNKEVLMTEKDIKDTIDFEDYCGVNTFLQNLLHYKDTVNYFLVLDKKGKILGYKIRDKRTGEDCQL